MSKPAEPRVYESVEKLRAHLDCLDRANAHTYGGKTWTRKDTVIAVSGGFDPVHIGHVKYIHEAAKLGDKNSKLVVIVNSDEWLLRKKGFVFMPLKERMEIIGAISGVDYVIGWDDGTPNVSGCLEILKPTIFANGGDRDAPENVPEYEVCQRIGCEMVFGVGGGKIQSSSELVSKANEAKDFLEE